MAVAPRGGVGFASRRTRSRPRPQRGGHQRRGRGREDGLNDLRLLLLLLPPPVAAAEDRKSLIADLGCGAAEQPVHFRWHRRVLCRISDLIFRQLLLSSDFVTDIVVEVVWCSLMLLPELLLFADHDADFCLSKGSLAAC